MKAFGTKKLWLGWFWCVAVVIAGPGLVLGEAPATQTAPEPADPIVAIINEEPVSAAEYRLVMEGQTAMVYSHFRQKQGLEDHLGYWSESTGPQGPLAKLRELAREELIRIKVTQGLAKEKRLIQGTSFAEFKADFERENARRSAARRAGEVVYGPGQYRLAAYYYVRLGDLVYKLKQAMAKEAEHDITESDVRSFYEENKATLDRKTLDDELNKRIRWSLALRQAEKQIETLRASARVEIKPDLLREIVPRLDLPPSGPSDLTK